MFSFTSRYLVSEHFHFKSKNTLFRRAGVKRFHFKISREKRYHDRGQEIGKYCPLTGTNQIAGFSGYRPLTVKQINKCNYFLICLFDRSKCSSKTIEKRARSVVTNQVSSPRRVGHPKRLEKEQKINPDH